MKIYTDMHTHTLASTHAYCTIIENAAAAKMNGMLGIAMTDHAPPMWDAPHVWHFHSMDNIPQFIDGVMIFKGVEANILDAKGDLGLDRITISKMDWIIASLHGNLYQPTSIEEQTAAYINAAKTGYVDCIGHCTSDFDKFDYEKAIKIFKEYGTIIEINEPKVVPHENSGKNAVEILKLCKKYEVSVCVNSDAHFADKIGRFSNSIEVLEAVDFPEKLVFNSDFDRVKEHIMNKKLKR